MLFHITHQHSPETCPASDPEVIQNTLGSVTGALTEGGAKVHGFYSHATGHRVYLIVECDRLETINDALFPLLRMGTATIEPITDAAETIARLRERARR